MYQLLVTHECEWWPAIPYEIDGRSDTYTVYSKLAFTPWSIFLEVGAHTFYNHNIPYVNLYSIKYNVNAESRAPTKQLDCGYP
jgi:hypothetical protein